MTQLEARKSVVLSAQPKVATVFDCANDMLSYATAQDFVTVLFSYVADIRATGAKVAVATCLPQQVPSQPTNNTRFNARRVEVNNLIRTGVSAGKADAVIDFAADPVMGPDAAAADLTLYKDGLHPTDGCGPGCGGQGKLATIYKAAVDRLLATIGI